MTKAHRKPIGNFFIKKSLQLRLITKVVFAVVLATLVCSGTLLLTYFIKYQSVAFYRVILDQNMDIPPRENIIFIILPSLLISAVVNVVIAFILGLYASRKYAVPIYKLEQWADLLNGGKFTAKLRFREKEEFKELSNHCNRLGETLRERFLEVKKNIDALGNSPDPHIAELRNLIGAVDLETSTIDVHTAYFRLPAAEKPEPGAA